MAKRREPRIPRPGEVVAAIDAYRTDPLSQEAVQEETMKEKSQDDALATQNAGAIVSQDEIPKALIGTFQPDEWATMSAQERQEAIAFFREEERATTDGLTVTFPRWKFPTAGATRFILETESQDAPEEKELIGVIVAKLPGRGYYKPGQVAAKGTPPLCASADAVVPDVSPSPVSNAKTCAACEFAQWGSGRDQQGNPTRGQACKYRIRTFFMRGDAPLPEYISLPPSAVKPLGQYATQLVQSRIPLVAVETVLGLAKSTNSQGTEYSGLTLKVGRRLSFAEMKRAREIAAKFESHMRRVNVAADEADEHAGSDANGAVIDTTATVVVPDPKAGF